MGFALWLDHETAWAAGTHEYRPMGAAVIALSSQFHARDFSSRRRAPKRSERTFAGFYASLEDVNRHLKLRQSQGKKIKLRPASTRVIATF